VAMSVKFPHPVRNVSDMNLSSRPPRLRKNPRATLTGVLLAKYA